MGGRGDRLSERSVMMSFIWSIFLFLFDLFKCQGKERHHEKINCNIVLWFYAFISQNIISI